MPTNLTSPTTRNRLFQRALLLSVAFSLTALLIGSVMAQESPSVPEVPAATEPAGVKAAILSLNGEITDVMAEGLVRRVQEARDKGASVIIFDMDTPGGLVTSSIAIADLIKNTPDVKTVAWVNPNAHSGGSIVAVACDEIVMARSSRMGDSQVIMGGPTGAGAVPEDLQAKAYTPVLAEFRASCRLNGYDQSLCEAFVLPERQVWWIEHKETGERRFVFDAEKRRLFGQEAVATKKKSKPKKSEDEEPDEDTDDDAVNIALSSKDAGSSEPPREGEEWKLVETYHDAILDMEVDTIQPVVRDDQLLEMSASEAIAYGFSKKIIADEDELRTRYGLSTIFHLNPNWSEVLAYWLTSMYVRGFLMVIIMLGAYVEFHTPGVGVPGLVALICLALFAGAPYLTGLANVWELLFIAVGVVLMGLELFVIPGFGIAGISGIMFVVIGVLATFVPDEPGRSLPLYIPSLPATLETLKYATGTMVTSMVASLVGMYMLSRVLPKMPIFGRIVPANPTPSEVSTGDPYGGVARVGDLGEAAGPLHPAGKALFGRQLVDVVTQGEYLDEGTRVEVIERRGNRVVVRGYVVS